MTPTEPTVTPIDWPTDDHTWWWMRWRCAGWRPSPQSRWRLTVIKTRVVDGTKWVCPLGGTDILTRAICQGWEAQFVPATPPPEEWQ